MIRYFLLKAEWVDVRQHFVTYLFNILGSKGINLISVTLIR